MVKSAVSGVLLLLLTISAAHGKLVIDSVNPGSPAEAAGVKAGDQILRLDGQEIATLDDLEKVTGARQPGDTVPLSVQRKGETVDLTLTFGERPGGGVSIGVSIALEPDIDDAKPVSSDEVGTVGCLDWIEKTYGIESMSQDLGLDLSEDYEAARACVVHDTRRMTSANAIRYCDNVFKVHCSGLDLLAEIGEAQVQQCEELLGESLGLRLGQYKSWSTCAEQEVFNHYSMAGEASDEEACKAALLDECGTNIEAAIKAGTASPEQRGFADCCAAEALDPERNNDSDRCGMIDDGFERGPCHDHAVCVNRLTTEWLHCSVLE